MESSKQGSRFKALKLKEFAGFYVKWIVYDSSQGKNFAQGGRNANKRFWLRYRKSTKIKLPLLAEDLRHWVLGQAKDLVENN